MTAKQHSRRRHGFAFAIITASISAGAAAQLPSYSHFQIQARSAFENPFNLPDGAFFNSQTPGLNDRRQLALKLDVISGSDRQGIWLGRGSSGEIVFESAPGALLGEPSLNGRGQLVFEQNFSSQDGLFYFDSGTGGGGLLTTDPLGASGWGSPGLTDGGLIGFRADFLGDHAYMVYDARRDLMTTLIAEAALEPDSPYSFLFTPATDGRGRIAAKARLGGPGEFGETQPDRILIFDRGGVETMVAEDVDSDPESPFARFDNGVSISESGEYVAFTATLASGVRGVYRWSNGVIDAITTDDGEVIELEFFAPDVNDAGLVVFRGFNRVGERAVFIGDGVRVDSIVSEHSIVATDLGPARIDQHDSSPTFGGAPKINNHGDVAFNATLTPPDNNQIEWGTGSFIASSRPIFFLVDTDLRAGEPAQFRILSGIPNAPAWFVYSVTGPGATPVAALDVTIDLAAPALIGNAMTDAEGAASVTRDIPGIQTPRNVWFQAVQQGASSNVVADVIE